ncbi:MAG: succinate dehydrogenase cytochrome b subunit [Anaerolineae bacterium]|nr:succinate dehydrogenase cytochrome b subunit [Anaerolineae bacterium]
MVGALTLYRSTIGRKIIMALTGLVGVGFTVGHMYGNLKAFSFIGGPEYFNEYAEGLRELGAPIFGHGHLLWIVRLVLLACIVLHVWAAVTLYQDSSQARNVRYAQQKTLQATLASLYMRVGGLLLFIFIIYHMAHLTWGIPGIHPNFTYGEAYNNLVYGLSSYFYLPAIFYLIAMVALGFHIYHGAWSVFQTLGLNNRTYTQPLRALSLTLAIVIAGGFAMIPLAVIFGILQPA